MALAKALELRAKELGLDPQFTSKLLFDLGQSRQQVYLLQEGNLDYQDVIHDLKQRLDAAQQANCSLQSQKEALVREVEDLEVAADHSDKDCVALRRVGVT